MLKHKVIAPLFILMLAVYAAAYYFFDPPLWGGGVLLLAWLLLTVYGSVAISSNYYLDVTCRAPAGKKKIAITFDDGPAETTGAVLDILKKNNVPAAFFCIGRNIDERKEMITRMDKEGHMIGNHSYSHHFFFDLFSSSRMLGEMNRTSSEIKNITGKYPVCFRPPYGVTNPNVARAVKRGGFTPVGWSVRSMDTAAKDENKLVDKVCSELKGGDVVLFHDTAGVTVKALQAFISRAKESGFEFARLDGLLSVKPYA